jgi:hypothetical protein
VSKGGDEMKKLARVPIRDRHLEFVLTNWDDVKAFSETVDRAKETLPNWLITQVRDTFKEMRRTVLDKPGFFADDEDEPECICWDTCARYDGKEQEGPYIGFYYANELAGNYIWEWLTTGDPNWVPEVEFWLQVQGTKKRQRTASGKWHAHLLKHESTLKRAGISIATEPTTEGALAKRGLSEVFTVPNMLDLDALRTAFIKSVMAFTKTMEPIIRSGPRI